MNSCNELNINSISVDSISYTSDFNVNRFFNTPSADNMYKAHAVQPINKHKTCGCFTKYPYKYKEDYIRFGYEKVLDVVFPIYDVYNKPSMDAIYNNYIYNRLKVIQSIITTNRKFIINTASTTYARVYYLQGGCTTLFSDHQYEIVIHFVIGVGRSGIEYDGITEYNDNSNETRETTQMERDVLFFDHKLYKYITNLSIDNFKSNIKKNTIQGYQIISPYSNFTYSMLMNLINTATDTGRYMATSIHTSMSKAVSNISYLYASFLHVFRALRPTMIAGTCNAIKMTNEFIGLIDDSIFNIRYGKTETSYTDLEPDSNDINTVRVCFNYDNKMLQIDIIFKNDTLQITSNDIETFKQLDIKSNNALITLCIILGYVVFLSSFTDKTKLSFFNSNISYSSFDKFFIKLKEIYNKTSSDKYNLIAIRELLLLWLGKRNESTNKMISQIRLYATSTTEIGDIKFDVIYCGNTVLDALYLTITSLVTYAYINMAENNKTAINEINLNRIANITIPEIMPAILVMKIDSNDSIINTMSNYSINNIHNDTIKEDISERADQKIFKFEDKSNLYNMYISFLRELVSKTSSLIQLISANTNSIVYSQQDVIFYMYSFTNNSLENIGDLSRYGFDSSKTTYYDYIDTYEMLKVCGRSGFDRRIVDRYIDGGLFGLNTIGVALHDYLYIPYLLGMKKSISYDKINVLLNLLYNSNKPSTRDLCDNLKEMINNGVNNDEIIEIGHVLLYLTSVDAGRHTNISMNSSHHNGCAFDVTGFRISGIIYRKNVNNSTKTFNIYIKYRIIEDESGKDSYIVSDAINTTSQKITNVDFEKNMMYNMPNDLSFTHVYNSTNGNLVNIFIRVSPLVIGSRDIDYIKYDNLGENIPASSYHDVYFYKYFVYYLFKLLFGARTIYIEKKPCALISYLSDYSLHNYYNVLYQKYVFCKQVTLYEGNYNTIYIDIFDTGKNKTIDMPSYINNNNKTGSSQFISEIPEISLRLSERYNTGSGNKTIYKYDTNSELYSYIKKNQSIIHSDHVHTGTTGY